MTSDEETPPENEEQTSESCSSLDEGSYSSVSLAIFGDTQYYQSHQCR